MIRMASVEQALDLIASHGSQRALGRETVDLADALGRRLAEPVIAQVNQPPADVSSMDGYAVRFADMAMNAELKVIGESRAGVPWSGKVNAREAIRIFTGAIMPQGADHVLIQEDTIRENNDIEVMHEQKHPQFIRKAGLDFAKGATLIPAGTLMTEGAISLAAAGNVGKVTVAKTPRIGVLANGDELVAPGSDMKLGQVVNSIQPALLALIRRWGATPVDLGLSGDTEEDVRKRLSEPCDVIVSIGGASVGDYDVVRSAFAAENFAPIFEKIAIKPGKPTWFSSSPSALVLGLPGNPAAAMVTAQLFLRPLIAALTGAAPQTPQQKAHTATALPKAGNREEYLRAILTIDIEGRANIQAAENQDSSLLSPFLTANALIRRPPGAAAAGAGDLVDVLMLA
ncbi:MAG TPA: molybdopterin molybdotransferase MoeA [Hyphomonadaceae bacterium]|nr:molybdopterin molybdotransferase MoeA [Hyphomonadaceae bacterium]